MCKFLQLKRSYCKIKAVQFLAWNLRVGCTNFCTQLCLYVLVLEKVTEGTVGFAERSTSRNDAEWKKCSEYDHRVRACSSLRVFYINEMNVFLSLWFTPAQWPLRMQWFGTHRRDKCVRSFLASSDVHFLSRWFIDMEGAPGTLYEGEKFQLLFKFSSRYPFDSPQVNLRSNSVRYVFCSLPQVPFILTPCPLCHAGHVHGWEHSGPSARLQQRTHLSVHFNRGLEPGSVRPVRVS